MSQPDDLFNPAVHIRCPCGAVRKLCVSAHQEIPKPLRTRTWGARSQRRCRHRVLSPDNGPDHNDGCNSVANHPAPVAPATQVVMM